MVDSWDQHLTHSARYYHNCLHCVIDQFNTFLYCWWANEFCVFEFIFEQNFVFTVFFVKNIFINPNCSAIWNFSRLNQILIRKLNYSDDSFIQTILIFLNVNNLKAEERQQKYFFFLPIAPVRRKIEICSRLIFLIQVNLKKSTRLFAIVSAKLMSSL